MKITDLEKNVEGFCLKIQNLHIEEKKIHGIIGGNGSGKTTLAKLIMGIIEPDKGRIDYEGWDKKDITLTAQRPYLLHRSVYENITYPLKIRKIKPDEEEIDEWLHRYGLFTKKNQYARSLSSGERQKLSFIRAVIFKPKLIIIDETFSNLEPDTVALIEEWILKKQEYDPITYILISHQMGHIIRLCDTVHVMHRGNILESGNCKDVLFHSKTPEIAQYMADQIIRMESG